MKKIVITQAEFRRYLKVQRSGVTNMFHVERVCRYSNLSEEAVFHIMKHYSKLYAVHGDVKGEKP